MRLTVEEVPVPDDPSVPTPGHEAVAEVEALHHHHLLGHTDQAEDAEVYALGHADQAVTRKHYLVARDGDGRALGTASVRMPLKDNPALAYVFLNWAPGRAPETEVYAALWAACVPHLDDGGRSVVHSWALHPSTDVGQGWVEPRSGAGRLGRDDRAAFLEAQGFALEQVELMSTLALTPKVLAAAGELADAPGQAAYRIRSWTGDTPAELRGGMARLRARMSVDAPGAGMDYEEEHWDEAEVVEYDRRRRDWGRLYVTSVALAEGEPVAYTELGHPLNRPEVAMQDDTLVHGEHRGHGLGLRIKAAALRELAVAAPTVRRVHTWNAAENAHMLAINTTLGFRPVAVQGGWQLRR